MRKIILGGVIAVIMLFSNCSKDDTNTQGTDNYVRNYLPLNMGNSWSYTFSRDLNGFNSEGIQDTRIKSVENDVYTWQKGGNMYLQAGKDIIVKKNDGVYSSDIKVPVEVLGINLDLELKGFVLLDEDASIEEEFYANEFVYNSDPESIENQDTGFSGNIVLNIKLIGKNQLINKLQSKTGISSVFEDVLETRTDLSLEMSLDIEGSIPTPAGITIPVNLTHMLITEQKIGDLVQFYANDVGLIESVSDVDLRNLKIEPNVKIVEGMPAIDINTLIGAEQDMETDYYFKEEFRLKN